ncbi:hypothetical protein GJAV_G00241900 [Gymnothorax javanicus]|nr:hypothetical protein GJAV_G00241900 [Gymnothorax javanicus]
MRALLCCAVTLLAVAMVCNAACTFTLLEVKDKLNPPKGCEDEDGEFHEFGSEWQKNCIKCSCSEAGAGCCDMILRTVKLPEECEMIVDREKCTSKYVLKCDNTKKCIFV